MIQLDNLKERLGKIFDCDPKSFVYPPNRELGDLSLPMFDLSKKLAVNPALIAKEQAEKFTGLAGISAVKAVGPYLNFYLDVSIFIKETISEFFILFSFLSSVNCSYKLRSMS